MKKREAGAAHPRVVSVGVVGGQAVEEKANRGLTSLAGEFAGVRFPDAQPAAVNIFIRGIGISRTIGNPSVGFYLDDMYLARAFGLGFSARFPTSTASQCCAAPRARSMARTTAPAPSSRSRSTACPSPGQASA
ncbi:hypothetical protein [Xylophilus sp.]|uniref:hypothetical protein n=1 Tax=Xylophilus sp. TaxID=2653893 RepID=UPI002D7EBC39|nr:hypothetical protein [Xylophilus sp.]